MKILITFLMLFAQTSFAQMDRKSNGGDDVGLEFQSAFQEAMQDLKTLAPEAYNQIDKNKLDQVLSKTRIVAVETPLEVSINGNRQESIAINDSATMTISVNRVRWTAIIDRRIKKGIALHEYLSLEGTEGSGQYPVSSIYVARSGLEPEISSVGLVHPKNAIQCDNESKCLVKKPTCQYMGSFVEIYVLWKVNVVCISANGAVTRYTKEEGTSDYLGSGPKEYQKSLCDAKTNGLMSLYPLCS